MNLFRLVNFISHAGQPLQWKIDCDALEDDDIETLAWLISQKLKFGAVFGIPEGGVRLENALRNYITEGHDTVLVVDDVLTTGASMADMGDKFPSFTNVVRVVIFARGVCPPGVIPLFQMNKYFRTMPHERISTANQSTGERDAESASRYT